MLYRFMAKSGGPARRKPLRDIDLRQLVITQKETGEHFRIPLYRYTSTNEGESPKSHSQRKAIL